MLDKILYVDDKSDMPLYYRNEVVISLFIYPTDAQLDWPKNVKIYIKFTLKCSYMFRFNNYHQGATIRMIAP